MVCHLEVAWCATYCKPKLLTSRNDPADLDNIDIIPLTPLCKNTPENAC